MPRLEVIAKHTAAELRHLSRHEDNRRAAMRMIGIAEMIDGADLATAALRADMSDQALRDAINRYNCEGIAGLYDRPRSGRRAKLSEEQRIELRKIVVKGASLTESRTAGSTSRVRSSACGASCCHVGATGSRPRIDQ